MKGFIKVMGALALAVPMAGSLAGCVASESDDRALTGAALGGTGGAIIGGLATRSVGGAVAGAAIGGAGGALIGAATTPHHADYQVRPGEVPYPGYGYAPTPGYGPAYAYYDGQVVGPPSPVYRKPPHCLQEGYDPYGRVVCLRFDYPYDPPHYRN